MRAVIQRVKSAKVTVNGNTTAEIGIGLLVFVGIEDADNEEDIDWLSNKLVLLRIFNDSEGIMNVNVRDAAGNILVVSQFTLHASTKKVIVLLMSGPQGLKLQYHFMKRLSPGSSC